ncbi:hypothetical protein SAMN05216266_108140 [Amycolatopsis marina]|uniref:Uncharacterized protein n=1 Tax=Amycolatopsis marina TaxID=490629 RepID=A0A1I1A793_9PSEU|nr:hypothetical protein [Amycolatopsis marina]SFB32300.1 hypothetical protein SAMN05216266_108140 [Amycolatopsis marina]
MTSRSSTLLTGERSVRPFRAALGVAVLAAVLLAAAGFVQVVTGAEPAFGSAPLLVVLAVVPVAVAVGFGALGRPVVAAGVLAGLAALVPGRILLDAQLAIDPAEAARPELYLPESLGSPAPALGLWLLIGGQLGIGVAGVLAARTAGRRAESVQLAEPGTGRTSWMPSVLAMTVLAVVGLLMAPFASDNAYLLGRGAFEGPLLALAGLLLIAGALPVVAGLAGSSGSPELARGCVAGLALGAAALALPNLVAAVTVPWIHVTTGPVLVLVASAGLMLRGLTIPLDEPAGPREPDATEGSAGTEAALPGGRRLHWATGALAVLTGAASVAGALTAQLVARGGAPAPDSAASPWLLVAGLLVAVPGVAMFVPGLAAVVRPALSVTWAGVLLSGAAVLDVAVAATDLGATYTTGQGVVWTVTAMIGATVTACCSAVAGMVEREDSEEAGGLSGGQVPQLAPTVITPLVATVILAVAAFGTPAITAPDYVSAGLWSEFGTPSWGLLAAVLTVLGAAALVPRSRPARAAAVLVGVACLLILRAAQLPLTASDIEGATAGTGMWLGVAGALAALLTAGLAVLGGRESR